MQPAIGGATMAREGTADRDADFSAWMTARQAWLLRTAYLLTGDHHVAEDLVQNTLAKVYLSWHKVRDRGSVDGYARRILVNENNSMWRRAWKKREVSSDTIPDWATDADGPSGADRSALWNLVLTLPRKQRAAVVLRYYEELTEAETAEVLGCSVGNVKSQTSRALAALRRTAAEHGISHEDIGEEE